MRTALFGLVAGSLLSWLRAPLGLDLLQLPAVEPEVAYFWRAIALFALALGFGARPQARVSLLLLASITIGFAIHSLLLAHIAAPGSTFGLAVIAAAGAAALAWLGRRQPPATPSTPADTDTPPPRERSNIIEKLGLAGAGAGAALAIEGIARHARLFGAALTQDESLMASVFLAAVSIGGAAFGWIGAQPKTRGLAIAVATAATAAATYASMHVVASIATGRGLDRYLRAYGLDTSLHGTIVYDALIAAACFVAPAFLLGSALCGAQRHGQVASLLAGAGVGLLFVPRALASAVGSAASDKTAFSAELLPLGTLIAVAGAALAVMAAPVRSAIGRWTALALTLICALPLLTIELLPQTVLSPWLTRPVLPLLVRDLPAGLLTIEPAPGELSMVTLDRRALSPPAALARSDAQRLALAFDLVPPVVRVRGSLRVLLVGQLTPERASVLAEAGAATIDRSGAWYSAMEAIEQHLFAGSDLPPGEHLAPSEARARIARGAYDLVIVPPVPGEVPLSHRIQAPESTSVVAWFAIDQPAWQCDFGAQVALASDGFEAPCVARLLNTHAPDANDSRAPLLVAAGRPSRIPAPIVWLGRRLSPKFDERTDASRAGMFARLLEASRQGARHRGEGAAQPRGAHESLLTGLVAFYRAQRPSSPFEKPAERVELTHEVLDHLLSAALDEPLNAFVRQLWEGAARVLAGKRAIEDLYSYVEPIAQRHAPWPELEVALAHADLESLDPDSARGRLEPLAHESRMVELWYLLGEAQGQTGDNKAAAESYRRGLELQPGNPTLRRLRAIAAVRAGDPAGTGLVEELLREDPEDPELQRFTGPGPYPPAEKGFRPVGELVH